MSKINIEEMEMVYKHVVDGAIALMPRNNSLSRREQSMRDDMFKEKISKFGYFYNKFFAGFLDVDGTEKMELTYVFPYPNSTLETFSEMLQNLQDFAYEYDYDCILLDEVEREEMLCISNEKFAA